MTRNRILMTCAIASLALGLSACSSDDDAPMMMTSMVTAAEMLEAAQSRVDAAQEAVNNLADDATSEERVAAYGELKVAELALTEAANLPENQPPPTAAEMLEAAQSRLTAAQADVDNLAADATPEEVGAAYAELTAAQMALTVAENLPENQPPPPTELQVAQAAAVDAATAAMIAAGTANTSADDADEAKVNAATMQTGETSSGHAYMARHYAEIAQTAYMTAKTASEAAAAATTVSAAVRAQVAAEAAMSEAVAAEADADTHAGLAMTAAGNELKIVGTVKTVGGTSLNANAGTLTEDDGSQVVVTGLIEDLNPKISVARVDMVMVFEPDANAMDNPLTVIDETVEIFAKPAVAARILPIGKTVDSHNDMARLMIIDQYVGSKKVGVFVHPTGATHLETTTAGEFDITPGITTDQDTSVKSLRRAGMYYIATNAANAERNAATLDAGIVADDAGAEQLYSYVREATEDNVDDMTVYLVRVSENVVAGTTAYEEVIVGMAKVDIPEATEYEHIHFGVWAALGEAAKNGDQEIDSLGIGFVQNFSDSGLTGDDMPNSGMAAYSGNWVAAVQVEDEEGNGDIFLKNGAASLRAYFETDNITATLTDLATLTGKITDDTFKGDTASEISDEHGLDANADFEGTFNGGFYGTKGAEAAGVFDFAAADDGGDNVGGAFRGAFGGAK